MPPDRLQSNMKGDGNMRLSTAILVILGLPIALFAQAGPKLSLRLERVQSESAGGREVRVRVQITNISQHIVDLLISSPEADFTFAVVAPDGQPAPLTKEGERRRSVPGGGSHVLVTLPPGQSTSFGVCVLSDLLDFSKSGIYHIVASRHYDPLGETDSSNVLEAILP